MVLHYTRPNYFDGDQVELPLTGRAGSDVTGGIAIKNHTDADAADGSTVLIKAADAVSDLPAPLRLELLNTMGAGLAGPACSLVSTITPPSPAKTRFFARPRI